MSYIRIWIHLVFGTKRREKLLTSDIRKKVISHIIENAKAKSIFINCINGSSEHLHILISLGLDQSITKTVQLIKGESSFWINKMELVKSKFEWADEYFAVSVSESQLQAIRNYILNQEEHHKRKSFSDEYDEFMKKYGFNYLG